MTKNQVNKEVSEEEIEDQDGKVMKKTIKAEKSKAALRSAVANRV